MFDEIKDVVLYNENCFDVFPKIEDKSINLFVLDLPYGQTACKWDTVIDLEQMWKDIKRIMKPNALIVFLWLTNSGQDRAAFRVGSYLISPLQLPGILPGTVQFSPRIISSVCIKCSAGMLKPVISCTALGLNVL